MKRLETILGLIFGFAFLALSFLIAVETLLRKLFNVSLQGADELGGYTLAVGSTIAFTLALFGRSHIRIDIFHERLPRRARTALNWLSALLLAAFALLLVWTCAGVIRETVEYGSTAQTPWATPLIYPQSVWFAGLAVFALVAASLAARASWLLFAGRSGELNAEFHPKGTHEELKEELDDFEQRVGQGPVHANRTQHTAPDGSAAAA